MWDHMPHATRPGYYSLSQIFKVVYGETKWMMKENKTAATIEPLYFKEQVNNIEETM